MFHPLKNLIYQVVVVFCRAASLAYLLTPLKTFWLHCVCIPHTAKKTKQKNCCSVCIKMIVLSFPPAMLIVLPLSDVHIHVMTAESACRKLYK